MQVHVSGFFPFILPVLVLLSLGALILISLLASRPKRGTTEWIAKIVSPDRFAPTLALSKRRKDYFATFLIIILGTVCSSLINHFSSNKSLFEPAVFFSSLSPALSAGTAYYAVCRLGGKRISALTASMVGFYVLYHSSTLAAVETATLFSLFLTLSSPYFLILSGALIGLGSTIHSGVVLLLIPCLSCSLLLSFSQHRKLPLLMWLCCIALTTGMLLANHYIDSGYPDFSAVQLSLPAISVVSLFFLAEVFIFLVVYCVETKAFSGIFLLSLFLSSVPAFLCGTNCILCVAAVAAGLCGSLALRRGARAGTTIFSVFSVLFFVSCILCAFLCVGILFPCIDVFVRYFIPNLF